MDYVNLIKKFEGYRPNAYGDYKQMSIGYGTKARPGETFITSGEAERRMRAEADKIASFVDTSLPGIAPAKRKALVSFGYNLGTGEGGLSDLIPDAKAGNWQGVADKMQRYIHAGGEVNDGLINRRAQEAAILMGRPMNAAQLQAQMLRERFGSAKEPLVIQQQSPDAGQGTNVPDKLLAALTGSGGDPESRIADANARIKAGREMQIASPMALAGSLAQQVVGQSQKSAAEDKLAQLRSALMQSVQGEGDHNQLARKLIASGIPKYADLGMKLMTQGAIKGMTSNQVGLKPVYGVDENGKPIILQMSHSGKAVQTELPEGVNLSKEPIRIDTGTGTLLLDPLTRQPIGTVPKDISGKKYQEARGKIESEKPAAQARAQSAFDKAGKASQIARGLINHPGLSNAVGPLDSQLPTVREDTANFETELETLKTKVFVSAITEMRELSKTGGALGSVTEREIEKMENSFRNLQLRQGDANMRENLEKLAQDFDDSIARIKQAYEQEYGSDSQIPAPATMSDDEIKKTLGL